MLRALLSLGALVAAAAAVSCPSQWYQSGYNCYSLSTYTATWRDARSTCQGLGGELVSVNSPAEQEILTSALRASDAWIGLNDLADDGHFEWSDGSEVHYVNWADGQPNDLLDQDCVSLMEDGSGKWDDNHCKYTKLFICKKPAV